MALQVYTRLKTKNMYNLITRNHYDMEKPDIQKSGRYKDKCFKVI